LDFITSIETSRVLSPSAELVLSIFEGLGTFDVV